MRRPQVMQRFSFNLKSRSRRDDAAANLPGESPDDSGESPPHLFSVAQICNLLYRRIAFCGTPASASAFELSDALPITNRRYGRLQICATRPSCALNTYLQAWPLNTHGFLVPIFLN
jgi:hypothetical protein